MIHIIICGHGEFADGLLSGARLLCGESPACDAVNFSEGMSNEALRDELQLRMANIDPQTPILFLTDILGGTPFRECSGLAAVHLHAEVISGANLQMLTEALVERDGQDDLVSFARELIVSAKECMILLSDKLAANKTRQSENTENDGI